MENEILKTEQDEAIKEILLFADDKVKEETKQEEPAKEETKQEEPAKEETKQEEPAKEETKQEEPAKEETKQEEPAKEETETEKKERKQGSGRKKLPRDENGNIIKPTEPATAPAKQGDQLDAFLEQYKKPDDKPQATPATPAKPQLDVSKFINGAVFLIVMDAAFPMLIGFLLSMFNPKYGRIKDESRKKLKLDKDEKALLEEGANEIVKVIFADANPILIFSISVGFIYYSKFEMLGENDFEPKKK